MALQFEARKIAMKQDRTGFVLTLAIHPDELPDELIRDFVGTRYGCALVRIKDDETATVYNNRVKQAGMLCRTPMFHRYVEDRFDLKDVDEDTSANVVCSVCGIESRSELNGNVKAQSLFDELIKEYEEWSLNDDPF